jgi:hypothetical protein
MKFFRNLFYKTFTGKIVKTVISLYDYLKDYEYISDTFYSDAFKIVLKEYLNVEIKKDWIGRLYGVVNPNINEEGKFDVTRTIIEFDDDNTNNKEYVKHWAHKQLYIIGEVFKIENLYHFIDLEFRHVGPKEADNYLLVFDIVSRKLFTHNLKQMLLHGFIYAVIAAIVLFIIL